MRSHVVAQIGAWVFAGVALVATLAFIAAATLLVLMALFALLGM